MGEEREKEIFIDKTAEKVFAELSPEDKRFLVENPDPIKHHFGLGMYIRNEFIYGKDLGWWAMFPQRADLMVRFFMQSAQRQGYVL